MKPTDYEWSPWKFTVGDAVKFNQFQMPLTWNNQVKLRCRECSTVWVAGDGYCPKCNQNKCDWVSSTVMVPNCGLLTDDVPVEWMIAFFDLIRETQHLTWLIQVNTPERLLHRIDRECLLKLEMDKNLGTVALREWLTEWVSGKAHRNVWIGSTIRSQDDAERLIPDLLKIPSAGRFLIVEHSMDCVGLGLFSSDRVRCRHCDNYFGGHATGGDDICDCHEKIRWVIISGDSGPAARPCKVAVVRDLVRQCAAAGVPCFVGRLGSKCYSEDLTHSEDCYSDLCALAGGPGDCDGEMVVNFAGFKDPDGADIEEWPEDLCVRQFPEGLR